MVSDTQVYSSADCSPPAPTSRLAAVATGLLVAAACLGYAGWSLFEGRMNTRSAPADGVLLAIPGPRATDLSPPPQQEPIPSARLFLDETAGVSELPVVNAHLEVPVDSSAPVEGEPVTPAIRQLAFQRGAAIASDQQVDAGRQVESTAARLSGTIETLPESD